MEIKPYVRKAHFYETDAMGIIHHANYIRWFEEARVDFMDQIGFGYEKSVNAGIDIVVLEVSCAYKTMVRFGDTVNITVSITEMHPIKMSVSYRVQDAQSGALRTTGSSFHCFYDANLKKPINLKKSLPTLYELFSLQAGQSYESS